VRCIAARVAKRQGSKLPANICVLAKAQSSKVPITSICFHEMTLTNDVDNSSDAHLENPEPNAYFIEPSARILPVVSFYLILLP
jgi:hypothetical protein